MPMIPGSSGGPSGPYPYGEGRYGIPNYTPQIDNAHLAPPEEYEYKTALPAEDAITYPAPEQETKAETLHVDNLAEAARLRLPESLIGREKRADATASFLATTLPDFAEMLRRMQDLT
ncbi:hypothetical protein ACFZB4_43125 [Streptomyces pseudovenezuelae]|uniref:hypothetical protein n=1 Tax=Streptomyces pseudovenezuelae TaxID=67350 RepID=UPI0036EA7857